MSNSWVSSLKSSRRLVFVSTVSIWLPLATGAHPHVFVDGGVDLVMSDTTTLKALTVTWLYDEFETLYDLSSRGIEPQPDGTLSEIDRETIRAAYAQWPDDFDGSAHLSIDGASIEMAWPSELSVDLVEGRLQLVFSRQLYQPKNLSGKAVEIAFYESTYFFSFKITNTPSVFGSDACDAVVVPYTSAAQNEEVQQSLALLSREETPDIANVGELFADKVIVNCAS